MSRTKKSLRNATTSIAGQLLNNLLRWICRMVFIYTLGKEYLGISSLYVNILSILSLSELGLGSAITYSLYKPLAEGDVETIKSQMQFFKKAYRIIGVIILIVGIAMMPFLPKLMRGTTDAVNIYVYYVLYLLQTVVSYLFFAYKGILLTADQKRYVNDLVTYAFQVGMNIVQIISLFVIRSFFIYTVIAILCEIMRNMVIALVVDRKYPYLKEIAEPLTDVQKKDVFSRVYAMSLYRISSVVGTATDNLVIAANISVMVVGLYDNYSMIIQVIEKLLKGFFQAFTSSLGNYYVLESKEQNEKMFRCLNRLNSWLVIFCSVSFMVLLQPFIELCFGEMYLLEYSVVVIIVYNFATNYQQNVVQIYKEASGLFVKGKYRAVMTAVLNLGISIILVRKIGLSGVFLGSIISRLVTTWWYDAWLLYRHGFEKSPVRFYLDCILTMLLIIVNAGIIEWFCRPWQHISVWTFVIRLVFCLIVPNIVCLIFFGHSEECQCLVQKGKKLVAEKQKR